jgi:putative ABC transport system permease protein
MDARLVPHPRSGYLGVNPYGLLRKERVEREMDEELRFHLWMRTQENLRKGLTPEEAERAALRRFGNVGRIKELCRDIRGGGLMETLVQDLRYGLRMMLRRPGFTLVAVLTLALGIGANAAIFSVVNGVLFRALPYRDPDRLMLIWETFRGRRSGVTAPNFIDWRDQNRVFEQIAASTSASLTLTGGGEPERLSGARVSGNYFELLGVQPILGRAFEAAEDQPGAAPVVLLGQGLWQRRFGADPDIVGKSVTLDGEPHVVAGVVPEVVRLLPTSAQLWRPLTLGPQELAATGSHFLRVAGRLKPEVTAERAEAEMQLIARRLEAKRPHSNTGWSVGLGPVHEQMVSGLRTSMLLSLGAVGFVLLIACANIANLLLARAVTRRGEMAIRLALGAGRARVFRQLLTERVVLAGLGGAAGLALAAAGVPVLIGILPGDIPRLGQVDVDGTVLGFTLCLVLLTGLVFSLAPGLQASQPDLHDTLKEGGRSMPAGGGRPRLRGALVVAEVALTLVLLVGAGLLARSFWRLQAVDPGFDPAGLAAFRLALPQARYPDTQQGLSFY